MFRRRSPHLPHPADLAVGDIVFTRVTARPFLEVAAATACWTNHVGIVVATDGPEPLIAESTYPLSRIGTWSGFVARSERAGAGHRVAVMRLAGAWTVDERTRLAQATQRRLGRWYATGFNLDGRRQFCSRFVREVVQEARGVALGEVQTFAQLLSANPQARQGFWRLWFGGRMPWARRTLTPASLYRDARLQPCLDGHVGEGLSAAR